MGELYWPFLFHLFYLVVMTPFNWWFGNEQQRSTRFWGDKVNYHSDRGSEAITELEALRGNDG